MTPVDLLRPVCQGFRGIATNPANPSKTPLPLGGGHREARNSSPATPVKLCLMKLPRKICYIHAGLAKTGSTSIQKTLFEGSARSLLLENGVLYPSFNANHWRLASAFSGDNTDMAANRFMGASRTAAEDQRALHCLAKELDLHREKSAIISSEFFEQLRDQELSRLRDYLGQWFDRFLVIMYIREPADLAASRVQEQVKNGVTTIEMLRNNPPVIDLIGIITRLMNFFGKDAIIIRGFGQQFFDEGGLLSDFLRAVGLDAVCIKTGKKPHNKSLTAFATLVADRLAAIRPARTTLRPRQYQEHLVPVLSGFDGVPFRLPDFLEREVHRRTEEDV